VQNGTPKAFNISLVTATDVTNREDLIFTGTDPWYKLGHFWDGQSMAVAAPSAVHAFGKIYCSKQKCGNDLLEHPAAACANFPMECDANGPGGQSQWDQSSVGGTIAAGTPKCPGWTGTPDGPPPYSSFSAADLARARPTPELTDQDYINLKSAAKSSGMYCAMSGNNGSCTKPTGTFSTNGVIQDSDIADLGRNFVAYFDFPTSGDPSSPQSAVTWKAAVGPCNDDPTLHRSVMLVVRYGSIDLSGQGEMVGFFLAPEGEIWMRGSGNTGKIHGTAIAKKLDFGGNVEVQNSPCWVRNLPNAMLAVTPQSWSEVDR
jgi:hypothetical protein